MSDQPKKGSPIAAVIIVLLLIAAAAVFYLTRTGVMTETPIEGVPATTTTAEGTAEVIPTKTFNLPGSKGTAGVAMTEQVDLGKAGQLPARIIGNPNAKLKLIEYTSLTCSHCAAYYAQTLPEVKKELVDKNVVLYEKRDFPLNAPALDAAMILRCLPDDKAEGVRELFYRNQNAWAYEPNYRDYLKKTAGLAGLSGEDAEKCFNDADLKAKIVADVEYAGKTYEIKSTPSFVLETIGSTEKPKVIVGQYPTQDFLKVLRAEIELIHGQAEAPASGALESAPAVAPEAAVETPAVETPAVETPVAETPMEETASPESADAPKAE